MQNYNNATIRILLVCDAPMTAWGLARLIESRHPELLLLGTAGTMVEAEQLLRGQGADVILLDGEREQELALIPALVAGNRARLLVVNSSHTPEAVDAAVLAGAHGSVGRREPLDILFKAIAKVHEGEFWVDRSATVRLLMALGRNKALADPERDKIARLTRKERQTIAEVARDAAASTGEIAGRLCISENTLRNHLTSIYAKLGVSNRVGLFDYAARNMSGRADQL